MFTYTICCIVHTFSLEVFVLLSVHLLVNCAVFRVCVLSCPSFLLSVSLACLWWGACARAAAFRGQQGVRVSRRRLLPVMFLFGCYLNVAWMIA